MSSMIDKEIFFHNSREMVLGAHKTIFEDMGKLKYVNLKYKQYNQSESRWLYNVDFSVEGDNCLIVFKNSDTPAIQVALEELEYLKIRPYYIAICVGFKNIIFYGHEEKGVQQ